MRVFFQRLSVALVMLVTGAVLAAPAPSYDTSSLVTQITTDIQNAASTLFPVLVISIGLIVGWRYVRRFGKSV